MSNHQHKNFSSLDAISESTQAKTAFSFSTSPRQELYPDIASMVGFKADIRFVVDVDGAEYGVCPAEACCNGDKDWKVISDEQETSEFCWDSDDEDDSDAEVENTISNCSSSSDDNSSNGSIPSHLLSRHRRHRHPYHPIIGMTLSTLTISLANTFFTRRRRINTVQQHARKSFSSKWCYHRSTHSHQITIKRQTYQSIYRYQSSGFVEERRYEYTTESNLLAKVLPTAQGAASKPPY